MLGQNHRGRSAGCSRYGQYLPRRKGHQRRRCHEIAFRSLSLARWGGLFADTILQRLWVSEHKCRTIRGIAVKGHASAQAPPAAPVSVKSPKSDLAYAFWCIFFKEYCEQPNNDIRLFPTHKTMASIYKDYFQPWCEQQNVHAQGIPKQSTWKAMRWHADFGDVKRRRNHTHVRCMTCANLRARMLASFANGADMAEYQQACRLHGSDDAVKV